MPLGNKETGALQAGGRSARIPAPCRRVRKRHHGKSRGRIDRGFRSARRSFRNLPCWRQRNLVDVGAREIVALKQQRRAPALGQRIGKAVTIIQPRGMAALAKAPPGEAPSRPGPDRPRRSRCRHDRAADQVRGRPLRPCGSRSRSRLPAGLPLTAGAATRPRLPERSRRHCPGSAARQ